MAVDVEHDKDFTIEEVREVIANVVIRWNVLRNYNNITSNCQHFVDELLEALDICPNLIYKGALGEYLKKMRYYNFFLLIICKRKTGSCSLEYKIPHELAKELDCKSVVKFHNHKDLDDFVNKLFGVCPTLQKTYPDDYKLLKRFV